MSGSETALAELFQRYRSRLRKMVVLRMDARVRGRFDASDVVQEAFVEVSRRLADYQEKHSSIPFFIWMRIVTADQLGQLHRTHLGTQKRSVIREVFLNNRPVPEASGMHLADQLAGQYTSVDRGMKRDELRRKLEFALNAMDVDDREVIAMRHYEELTPQEIALILGITRSGVLKRYSRAIMKLSAAMGGASEFSLG